MIDKNKTLIGLAISGGVAIFFGAHIGYFFLLGWLVVDLIKKEEP